MGKVELPIIIALFVADLRACGYTACLIKSYGKLVEQCAAWLAQHQVSLRQLDEAAIARCLSAFTARYYRRRERLYRLQLCRRALRRWLLFLRQEGWLPPGLPEAATPAERLLQRYAHHLAEVRGLALGTRRNLCAQARRFLRWWSRKPATQLEPCQVVEYLVVCRKKFVPSTARNQASGLRSFLRFLEWIHYCRPHLAQAVLPLAPWPREDLPGGLTDREYRQLLASFDRKTPLGRRNYALALCLGELGLRASEAVHLKLEDLNWRTPALRLPSTKQHRERLLPLPPRVAQALARYLQGGRPVTASRAVFVRHHAPLNQALSSSQVSHLMSQAFARSGLSARGTHALRYYLATRLQRRGAGLKAIADLLGHQCLESSARYARIDFKALRQAALPWPEDWP